MNGPNSCNITNKTSKGLCNTQGKCSTISKYVILNYKLVDFYLSAVFRPISLDTHCFLKLFINNFQRQNARPLSLSDVHWMVDAFQSNTYAMELPIVWMAMTRIPDSALQVTNELIDFQELI